LSKISQESVEESEKRAEESDARSYLRTHALNKVSEEREKRVEEITMMTMTTWDGTTHIHASTHACIQQTLRVSKQKRNATHGSSMRGSPPIQ
jgi:hypothetical protein